ncbi:acyl-CoA dehydrogenase [Sulfurimonas sp. SAG-AH-194-C21]|nr:acyl-CoA dehydrogenase [Sulfurimonas sp. SAG-AH-194-C21]
MAFWINSLLLFVLILVTFTPNSLFWIVYIPLNLILLLPTLRLVLISGPIVSLIKKLHLMPSISETEKIALRAGDIWIDGDFFSGTPDFKKILNEPYPSLTNEENQFLNTKVDEVCAMTNDFEVFSKRDLSPEVWQYLKENIFLGMIIPKEYGGLGFSALAHSCVVQKLASHSQVLAITTMVPNSLGPAELILQYGTQEQKEHYLPRLADGREIPCFALTEPLAGSDATSISSRGEVFEKNGEIFIRLNFNKRYITLGSIATLIGLAFVLFDPDELLGKGKDLGITCALVDASLEGVLQGQRHDPLGVPFINSPISGKNVVIKLSNVIGTKEGISQGWLMLMESLSVGRGISLPSTSTGGVKLSAAVAGSYSSVREQFGLSISKFEGVEEVLARLAGNAYMLDAARIFTLGAIDSGKKPAVINAVMKYHSTEIFRRCINDAMDIVGGAGISLGDKNLLGHAYMGAPIAITVEGANIMTRTLIQFGQGVIRCHPYAYTEIQALESGDVENFDKAFFSHIGFALKNMLRMILLSLTRGYLHSPVSEGVGAYYERKLVWSSATFAFLTDFVMAHYGGGLKQQEKITARFGDILSSMYLLSATLRRYKHENNEDDDFVRYIGDAQLRIIDNAFNEILANLFKSGVMKYLFAPVRFYMRLNTMRREVDDDLSKIISNSISVNGEMRDKLVDGIYHSQTYVNIQDALKAHENVLPSMKKIKTAIRKKQLPKQKIYTLLEEALDLNIITLEEKEALAEAKTLKESVVQVDGFDVEVYLSRKA